MLFECVGLQTKGAFESPLRYIVVSFYSFSKCALQSDLLVTPDLVINCHQITYWGACYGKREVEEIMGVQIKLISRRINSRKTAVDFTA